MRAKLVTTGLVLFSFFVGAASAQQYSLPEWEGTWLTISPPYFHVTFVRSPQGPIKGSLPIGIISVTDSKGESGSNYKVSGEGFNCFYSVTNISGASPKEMIWERKEADSAVCFESAHFKRADTLGELNFQDGSKYYGNLDNGVPHGEGTITSKDGSTSSGMFVLGKKNGSFKEVLADGSRYEGGYLDDVRAGQGKLTWLDGLIFEGIFSAGMPSSGTITYKDGSKYVGSVHNYMRNGNGTLYFSGIQSVGIWKDDRREGQFSESLADGSRYVGEYSNDVRSGHGRLVQSDGSVMEGTFKDGLIVEGICLWNNLRFVGKFNKGRIWQGTVYGPAGQSTGAWDSNFKKAGNFSEISTDGTKFEGLYVEDWREGPGKLILQNSTIEGVFAKGFPEQGTQTFDNGDKYVGSFVKYLQSGQGTLFYKNGSIANGIWLNGQFISGLWTASDGYSARGTWEGGKKTGFFSESWRDGSKFEGNYQSDLRIGKGKWTLADGTNYDGTFLNSEFVEGTISIGDYRYVGKISRGRKNGPGTLYYQGNRSAGNWVDDARNGLFDETFADGTTFVGTYQNNVRSGQGKMGFNGNVFEGTFENGQFSFGTLLIANGDKYVGSFINNRYSSGTFTSRDGQTWTGTWVDGKFIPR